MNVFTLFAQLKMDTSDFDKSMNEAEKKANGLGSKMKSAAKVIGAGVTAAAAAVGTITKEAVSAYGAYQQLEGGIETLFGKDAQTMLTKAQKAYKTAGVSANQYMEMAIQSSAAMITSLEGDTAQAAELMDMSIIDMSDNVNKMGTTMEAVQNAYRGFSRGNFTMLDNLALGYAGTKKGMQELLERATEISRRNGEDVEYSIESYADMVKAIHVVQTEMGITGTTSKEAGDTITGSAGSARAAWEDLKVAMASGDDAKLSEGIENLINSVTVMGQNIIPIFERALSGVGQFVEKVVPLISERLPSLVEDILPGLISAATSLITGVVKALPSIIKTLIREIPKVVRQIAIAIKDTAPIILKEIANLLKEIADGLDGGMDGFVTFALSVITSIWNAIVDNLPTILDAGLKIVEKLAQGIVDNLPKIVNVIVNMLTRLLTEIGKRLPEFLQRGVELIKSLIQGFVKALPDIIRSVVKLIKTFIKTIVDNLPQILEAGVEILLELAKGIMDSLPILIESIPDIIIGIVDALLSGEMIEKLLKAGLDILLKLLEGLLDFGSHLDETIGKLIEGLLGAVFAAFGAIMEIGKQIVTAIWDGIKGAWDGMVGWVESRLEDLLGDCQETIDAVEAATKATEEYYKGTMSQFKRNHELYGSAYGITGQKSYAGSNSMAAIQYERARANEQSSNARSAANHAVQINATVNIGGKGYSGSVSSAITSQNALTGAH